MLKLIEWGRLDQPVWQSSSDNEIRPNAPVPSKQRSMDPQSQEKSFDEVARCSEQLKDHRSFSESGGPILSSWS